jgi:hypothetical protein
MHSYMARAAEPHARGTKRHTHATQHTHTHTQSAAHLLRLLVIRPQEEAKAAAALLNHARAHVAGHDDERVLEVHGAALAVRQAAVLQNLAGARHVCVCVCVFWCVW